MDFGEQPSSKDFGQMIKEKDRKIEKLNEALGQTQARQNSIEDELNLTKLELEKSMIEIGSALKN
jgi:hypothetical protein